MPDLQDVIEILSDDSDNDELQVISHNPALEPLPSRSSSAFAQTNDNNNHNDEVQITGERPLLPTERRPMSFSRTSSPDFMVHLPNDQAIILQGREGHQANNNHGTRSFANSLAGEAVGGINIRRIDPTINQAARDREVRSAQARRLQQQIEQRRSERRRIERRTNEQRQRTNDHHAEAANYMQRMFRNILSGRNYNGLVPGVNGLFHNLNQEDNYDEDMDQDYYPGMDIDEEPQPPFNPFGHRRHIGWMGRMGFGRRNDEVGQDIMAMLERRDNAEFDARAKTNQESTSSLEKKIEEQSENVKDPFTTAIDPDEEYVCALCGVTLGVGIPSEFKGDRENTVLEKLQERYEVEAPYRSVKLITDVDKDLSKRIFFANCGHTYCGRCVKNITNVKEQTKVQKLKIKKTDNVIENPYVYAPSRCVVDGCNIGLRGRKGFNEVFL